MAKAGGGQAYVALLRGINVGGHNKLPMADLAALCAKAGGQDVKTYIQSGNAVFTAAPARAAGFAQALAALLQKEKGLAVPVIVRSAAQLAALPAKHPLTVPGAGPKQLHVGFLARVPVPALAKAWQPPLGPDEAVLLRGAELFVRFPLGVAGTKLTNAHIDAKLGTTVTLRNWNTVQALLEQCQ
jgi:uncharacterized protein (DUF1697 family)